MIARRWAKGWELHIDGVGVTQSHVLEDADFMACDHVSRVLEVSGDSFGLETLAEIGGQLLNVAGTAELVRLERPRGRVPRILDAIRTLGRR